MTLQSPNDDEPMINNEWPGYAGLLGVFVLLSTTPSDLIYFQEHILLTTISITKLHSHLTKAVMSIDVKNVCHPLP